MTRKDDKLKELIKNLIVHEEMGVEIPERLRRTVWLGLASTSIGIFLWAEVGEPLAQIFVPLNIIGLLMLLSVLFASDGMTQPVQEGWHKVAWMASVPSAVNVFATGLGVIILIVLVILALICVSIFFLLLGAILG